ncbi:MAG: hypothetical protein AAB658_00645, partial [Chloroflexota bacterium]
GHAGEIEAPTARHNRVVMLAQFARAEANKMIEYRILQELHGLAREEERDAVAFIYRGFGDEKARAARVGASGPWVRWTRILDMAQVAQS